MALPSLLVHDRVAGCRYSTISSSRDEGTPQAVKRSLKVSFTQGGYPEESINLERLGQLVERLGKNNDRFPEGHAVTTNTQFRFQNYSSAMTDTSEGPL
jgi:hypothetical protein